MGFLSNLFGAPSDSREEAEYDNHQGHDYAEQQQDQGYSQESMRQREEAALQLQSIARGRKARQMVHAEKERQQAIVYLMSNAERRAVILVQHVWRDHVLHRAQAKAATSLQCAMRCRIARTRVSWEREFHREAEIIRRLRVGEETHRNRCATRLQKAVLAWLMRRKKARGEASLRLDDGMKKRGKRALCVGRLELACWRKCRLQLDGDALCYAPGTSSSKHKRIPLLEITDVRVLPSYSLGRQVLMRTASGRCFFFVAETGAICREWAGSLQQLIQLRVSSHECGCASCEELWS